ncbi:uncharacterized protein LOC105829948 [Monomorium pharaonis]|uniref:uncharacterized protein LOC105829948 n=1 Tax=Monomorium pharaonis TaxID=307658 RepID=UPI001747A7AB|nr:uncharacterized protein LOC105829948 [Monomorium pharaonis]
MQILSLNFLMYTFCGMWRPIKWSSNGAKLLYSIFTVFVMFLEYFWVLTQFLDIVLVIDNIDDFVANSLMLVSVIAVSCKATIVVIRRNAIISLVQILINEPCKPQDKDEVTIQTKFDQFIRSCSIKYSFLATSSLTGVVMGGILNVMHGHLPYRIWLPWDYNNVSLTFWIISIQQIVTIIFATIINVGTETLVFGLFLQTCAQFEIFESRLCKVIDVKNMKCLHTFPSSSKDKTKISESIHHHLTIYKYAKTVNVIFNQVLFIQFFGSILVLCTSVYYLSTHISELSGLATLLAYTICMFVQIYLYCWSGNEVILKSLNIGDAIYHMKWPLLPVSEKKELLMIMIRSTIPIKFTSSFLITLSLQSYSNVSNTVVTNTLCNEKDPNMQILSLNFSMYTVGGIWRPVEWSSNGAKLLYSIFTFIVVLSQYFLVLTQFMDIIFVVNNIDDFATNTLMFFTMIAVCCKATVVIVRRNELFNLVQGLLEAPYKPQDEDEIAIQIKFDKFIRSCSIKYALLATCSVTGLSLGAVLNALHGHLPYRIWLPWNYNNNVFWILSIYQIFIIVFAAIINVGTETLVFGLFIETCAQLEIFENRVHKFITNKIVGRALTSLSENKIELPECVRYHLSIYKFAKMVNVLFNQVLFVQFFASIIVLCTSVYYLSNHSSDISGLVFILAYTICMFAQIFVYCWSGNEVILKSLSTGDTIYRMDWPLLPNKEKKGLLMIMMRSTIPIKFTSSFLIILSLQSYNNILKASYSTFNVLKQ